MSDTPLAGKNALVTGAAHRTGRDLALGLARAGADVAIHFHTNEAAAREVVTEIQGLGRRALAIPADLTDADEAVTVGVMCGDVRGTSSIKGLHINQCV